MKKINTKALIIFFNSKRNLRIVYTILTIIAIYYSVITGIYLLFLIPLIVMWLIGTEGVEFINIPNSHEVQRTDISCFTTGDITDSLKLLLIIAILVFVIVILRKMEKKLP